MDCFCAAGLWEANILWNLPNVLVECNTHKQTPSMPVRLSCSSCCYGCSVRNIVALLRSEHNSSRKTNKKEKGWGGVGWGGCSVYMCVVLRGTKTQQPRVLHHPINYSHCTMSSTTLYMTHMLRKISRAVKSMGIGWKWKKKRDQTNRTILQSTQPLTVKVLFQPKLQSTSITTE